MKGILSDLKRGGSLLALAAAASAFCGTAKAQTTGADASPPSETVVVTGTNIRGVAPVGTNLVSIGQEAIQSTGAMNVQQALENVPALSSTGSAYQGQISSNYYSPAIHDLGAGASNATLVLIDGHRIPTGGTTHSEVDPNIIPILALQRIDVVADGSSAVYGSDAIAGVINFITRKNFDGEMLSGQASFANGQTNYGLNALAGTSWDKGSVMLAYSYSFEAQLKDTARPYTNPNQTSRGGKNFNTFNCDPATIQPNGSGNIYLSPTSSTNVANSAANSPCSSWAYGALLPTEKRNTAMIKVDQDITSNLSLTGEMVYAARRDSNIASRGTFTVTAFGSGAQANPFYAYPPGVTATKETVRWDADALLGPGAQALTGSDTMYGDVNLEYHIGDNFVVNLLAVAGRDESFTSSSGTVNGSVVNLALNGTTNSGGNPALPSIVGTNAIITSLPLTAANALDVWNPASSNRTSAAVLKELTDNNGVLSQVNGYQQFRIIADGRAFDLPAGPVRVAFGAELYRTQLFQSTVQPQQSGPSTVGSTQYEYDFHRNDYSAFAEMDFPIINAEMNVPLVRRLEFNLSGRYDDYSDFGVTANPKFAVDWTLVDGLKIRANTSTSFVAPGLDVVGLPVTGLYASSRYNAFTNNVDIPVATYPAVTQFGIPGCTASSVTCNISTLNGIRVNNGNPNAKPQKGRGWSIGVDYAPEFIPGLDAQVTLWDDSFKGGITAPTVPVVAYTSSINNLLTFYPQPGGLSAAQIATLYPGIPQSGALPNRIDYALNVFSPNVLNLFVRGIDASLAYNIQTDIGTFKVADSLTELLKYDESEANGSVYSVLNTTGFNTTFPSVATQMRGTLGWAYEALTTDIYINYTGSYHNWSGSSTIPVIQNSLGYPSGGGDSVKANITIDLYAGYDFSGGILGDDTISVSIRNVFSQRPPFYNSSAGYDNFVANPLGRVVSVNLSAKL